MRAADLEFLFDRKEAAAVDSPPAEDFHRAARQNLQTEKRQKPMLESSSDNSVTRSAHWTQMKIAARSMLREAFCQSATSRTQSSIACAAIWSDSASFRPRLSEWSPPSTQTRVAFEPIFATVFSSKSLPAKVSFVPLINSIGIFKM